MEDLNKLDRENFIRRSNKIYDDLYDYSEVNYVNQNIAVKIKCPYHGYFYVPPKKHLTGDSGCLGCMSDLLHLTREEFIKRANKLYGGIYDYSKVVYINYKKPVIIICKKHGEFKQSPLLHLKSKQLGCPRCRETKLEVELREFFTEKNIKFESQKKFDWLHAQAFDFYLPDYNTAIECQGNVHFRVYDFFGGEKGLTEIIERDEIKSSLCKEHNIKLYYFSCKRYYPKTWNLYKVYLDKEEMLNDIINYGNPNLEIL